jgi:hypothetical protein
MFNQSLPSCLFHCYKMKVWDRVFALVYNLFNEISLDFDLSKSLLTQPVDYRDTVKLQNYKKW